MGRGVPMRSGAPMHKGGITDGSTGGGGGVSARPGAGVREEGGARAGAVGWTHLGRGAHVGYWPAALHAARARALMDALASCAAWEQRDVRMFGRAVPQPRLVAYYADDPHRLGTLTYSGLTLSPHSSTDLPTLREAQAAVEAAAGLPQCTFNTVLLNLYRDGRDHVGWHADDEALYGPHPLIGSLSLGEAREFVIRSNTDHNVQRSFQLGHGDVLVMRGTMQSHWQHRVTRRPTQLLGPRVNLTFRTVVQPDDGGRGRQEESAVHRPRRRRKGDVGAGGGDQF